MLIHYYKKAYISPPLKVHGKNWPFYAMRGTMTSMPKLSSHVLNPVIIEPWKLNLALGYWQALVGFIMFSLQELSRNSRNLRILRFSQTTQQPLTVAFEPFSTFCSYSAEIIAVSVQFLLPSACATPRGALVCCWAENSCSRRQRC